VLQGAGDGTFTVTDHFYQLNSLTAPFVAGDLNGDHKDDLAELIGFTSAIATIPAATGPSLDISLDSSPIAGKKGSAAVALNLPASSATTVLLSASDSAVQMPSSLLFNPGQQTKSFAFTLGTGFDVTHAVALYAKLGTERAVTYGNKPNPHAPAGVVETLLLQDGINDIPGQISVSPGESFSLTLQLQSADGYTGTFSGFACNGLPVGATCTFAKKSLTIYPGKYEQVNFDVTTSPDTPFGSYSIPVVSSDGFVKSSVNLPLGIGDFALSINPTMTVMGPTGMGVPQISSTSTNGLKEYLTVTCDGLPPGVMCGIGGLFNADGDSVPLYVTAQNAQPGDYPFQITGKANIVSHTIDATLRVGDFTAVLDKTSATISAGQSATFTMTLASVNHYASTISVTCQSSNPKVTCVASPNQVSLADGGTANATLTATASASKTPTGAVTRLQLGGLVALVFLPFGLVALRS